MAPSSLGPYYAEHSSDMIATLRLSQQAPSILDHQSSGNGLFLTAPGCERAEEQERVEQLFIACLQTGDDKSALLCLERMTHCFGQSSERVKGLHGLYEEAVAESYLDLEKCLQKYNRILQENPVNVPILKRRVALLRSMSRTADAIIALIELVGAIPTDAEAWGELADLYQLQGMSSQAMFCLEEALLITPNAWNIIARLGELLCSSAASLEAETACKLLGRSVRLFCRSIELCDDYLRGFYGLALATSLLLNHSHSESQPYEESITRLENAPSKGILKGLHTFATKRLGTIIQYRLSLDHQDRGHSQSELAAAEELLTRLGKSY